MPKQDDAYTYQGWIEALLILSKYHEPGAMMSISAEHDSIYAGPDPAIVSTRDKERLEELRWHEKPDMECFIRYT